MLLKHSKTNGNKALDMLKNLLCTVCLVCIVSAGCESDSTSGIVRPQREALVQPVERLHSGEIAQKQIEQLNTMSANLAKRNDKISSQAFSVSETAKRGPKNLGYRPRLATALKSNTMPSAEPPVGPVEISPASDTALTAPGPASSQTRVNVPALNEPGMADELISINFDQVDIRTVLKTIGDITGINFVVDKSVSGPVTVMSPTKIRLGDVYGVLESILDVQGYAAIPGADLVKIVPRAQAAKRSPQVRIGSDPDEIPKTDSIVTQIMPLNYADATEISRIIQPLLATGSQMATYPRTNSIVVTDTSSNIHHLARIIQELDVTGSKEDVSVFSLEHASAQVLSEQITRIMQKKSGASPQTARSRSAVQIETGLKILPDARTNSLIVVANAQDTETIRGLVEQLDVERPLGTNNVHVVYLKNAESKDVAQSLTAALTNLKISGALEAGQSVQVTADEGTNSLIIAASAQDFEVIAEIIDKLDIVREQVLVEMQIMEVSEDSLREIGVDWATLDQAVDGSVRFFGATGFGPRVDFASGNLEGLALGAWRGAGSNLRIGTILHALQKVSGVNILSTPHILTSNHHKAKIVVGENIPFVMESRITEGTDPITPTVIKTFEYKDVGISLEITPHISQGGLIRLEVNTEFTKLIGTVTSDTPSTAKREAQTVISMNSGSTIVIGGLIRDDIVTVQKKVPLLGDIPLFGALFRFQKDQLQKTNLLIFITPHAVSSQQDLEQITEKKKQEMAPALEDLGNRNGRD